MSMSVIQVSQNYVNHVNYESTNVNTGLTQDSVDTEFVEEKVVLCKAVLSLECNFVLYFFKCLSREVLHHYFFRWCTELTQPCSSSGSIFFTLWNNRRSHALKTITN